MPSAVPHSTHASPPALQCVCRRAGAPSSSSSSSAPRTRERPVRAHVLLAQLDGRGDDGVGAVGQAGDARAARPTTGSRPSAGPRRSAPPRPARGRRRRPASAARATANPPATPIAGAPRTARRRMASIIVSTSRTSSHSTSWGSFVWSTRTAWSPRHSMVRIGADRRIPQPCPPPAEPFGLADAGRRHARLAHGHRPLRRRRRARALAGRGAADELGDGPSVAARRPARVPAAVGRRSRRRGAVGRDRRPPRARVPRPHPPLRGPRSRRRRPRRPHGRPRRVPHGRADERRRLAAAGVADRPAGPDQPTTST